MKVAYESIKNKERYEVRPDIDRAYIMKAIDHVLKKVDQKLEDYVYKFPAPASEKLVYPAVDNVQWTSSFWTGMLWLAYEVTGDEKYRKVAEIHLDSFKERIEKRIETDTHDLGFLYSLSCVAAYKLTGNEVAKDTAIKAADLLIARYFEKAGIIQAWGDLQDDKYKGRMIIDCNLNLPLLYWATDVTGNPKYRDIAEKHVQQAAKYLVRPDSSTFHTYYMNTETGEPKYGSTYQGYSDTSCWARGQAWGIYGFTLSYIYTKDWNLIELVEKLSNYFLNRLPQDEVCYWDLIFTEGEEERDSSAAAIAVCGIMEMLKYLPLADENRKYYENSSLKILKSLTDNYLSEADSEQNGVLIHGVYNKHTPYNENRNVGVDESCIWGDYYYFEALVRALKDWELYW
jgi:unsaturated chondroitin disaccharide hydrolase